jgi:hypothetical protein
MLKVNNRPTGVNSANLFTLLETKIWDALYWILFEKKKYLSRKGSGKCIKLSFLKKYVFENMKQKFLRIIVCAIRVPELKCRLQWYVFQSEKPWIPLQKIFKNLKNEHKNVHTQLVLQGSINYWSELKSGH